MDAITLQLIIALLPVAEKIVFTIGGQLVALNTSTLTDPAAIKSALLQATSDGFPQLEFKTPA